MNNNELLAAIGAEVTPELKVLAEELTVTPEDILQRNEQEQEVIAFHQDQVFDLAKQELNFFAPLVMPEVFEFDFPETYIAIWQLLIEKAYLEREFTRLALGLPRGFAKTTFMKLFIAYLICYTDRRFILIVCASAELAQNILADVMDMLSEPNVKAIFGDWELAKEKDTQKVKKFGFRGRNVTLVALGAGSSLRGINLKHTRPDFILMDDIQAAEDADSVELSDKLLRWMLGTLMKAASKKRCMYTFLGNMYSGQGSILRKLKHNPTWVSVITGALLADGESIWPALQSKEQLLAEFQNDLAMGHPEIFAAEVLNDENAGSKSGIDVSKIPIIDEAIFSTEPQGKYVVIDPANDKKGSDNSEIGYFEIYDGVSYLRQIASGIMSPTDTIMNTLRLCLQHNCKVICVESEAYQYSLIHWFQHFTMQYNIEGMHLCELYSGGRSKNYRIKEMLKEIVKPNAMLKFGKDVRSVVIQEIVSWNPIRIDNVDNKLDICAYSTKAVELYGHLMETDGSIDAQGSEAVVYDVDDNCPF